MPDRNFAQAVLNPEAAIPEGLTDPLGRPAPKRFAVYRNNVTVSLTKAMEDGFPTVRKVVGDGFFAAMAREYLRGHPPKSPILTLFGADFADFLMGFAPVAQLGYLPDTARLDYMMRLSYHAADSVPADLSRVDPEALMAARVTLAPAVALLASDWPLFAIWRLNHGGGEKPVMRAESVLITRPAYDPEPHLLPRGGGAVIEALLQGEPLGSAFDAAPNCDPAALLGLLIRTNAILRIDR